MASINPIHLKSNPGAWHAFALRNADLDFRKFCDRVFKRDHNTCQYCGFQAKQFQEVVNLDQNYNNNKLSNLVTACCFCAQCFFLEFTGRGEYGGGALIYLPEISQTDLNGLCHVLFCAMANATNYRGDAQTIYNNLRQRARLVEDRYGENMSNPTILGQMLIDAQVEHREEMAQTVLRDLKLLPSRTRFSKQIEMWAAAALNEVAD
jgi:intracellular multiplication protein IcmJ